MSRLSRSADPSVGVCEGESDRLELSVSFASRLPVKRAKSDEEEGGWWFEAELRRRPVTVFPPDEVVETLEFCRFGGVRLVMVRLMS